MWASARQGTAWPRTYISSPEAGRSCPSVLAPAAPWPRRLLFQLPQHSCSNLRRPLFQLPSVPAPSSGGSCSSCRSVPAPSSRTSLSSDELRDAVPQHRQQALRVPLQDPASHLRSTPSRNTVSSYPHPHTQPAEHYLGRDTSSQYVCVKGMHDLLKTKQETTQKSRPQDTTLLMSQQGKAILRNCLRRRNVK